MMSLFFSIAVVHLIALMSPGPDFFFVTRTAMSQSRPKAMLGVLGIAAGIFVWAGVSILGLHILFETISWLQRFIAIAGGLYLLWMGINLLRYSFNQKNQAQEFIGDTVADMKSPFLYGLLTNLANPKAVIYFGSIFSTFITTDVTDAAKLGLFVFVVLESFAWFGFVSLVFGSKKPRELYKKAGRWIDAVAGALFSLFGAGLVWTNR